MTSQNRTYYQILGVSENASFEDIRSAFRRLARENHPDRNPSRDAAERMRMINEAYEVLRDPERRSAYDRARKEGRPEERETTGSAGEASVNISDATWYSIVYALSSLGLVVMGLWLIRNTDFLGHTPFVGDFLVDYFDGNESARYLLATLLLVLGILQFLKRWRNAQQLGRVVVVVGVSGAVALGVFIGDPIAQDVAPPAPEQSGNQLIQAMNSRAVGDCFARDGPLESAPCGTPDAFRIEATKLLADDEGPLSEAEIRDYELVLCPPGSRLFAPTDELWNLGYRLLVCLSGGPTPPMIASLNTRRIGECIMRDELFEMVPCDTPGAFRVEATRLYADNEGPLSSDEIQAHAELYCPPTTSRVVGPTEELWNRGYQRLVCLSDAAPIDLNP